jgi:hypothetical protein
MIFKDVYANVYAFISPRVSLKRTESVRRKEDILQAKWFVIFYTSLLLIIHVVLTSLISLRKVEFTCENRSYVRLLIVFKSAT